MVTNNPAFGLNALGGAVNVQMKNGFNYHGAEIDTMGGSFGRVQSSAQWGKQVDKFSVYGALEGLHDDGFRNFSASDVRRFYGDVGYKNDNSEFHLNIGAADNKFGATCHRADRVAPGILGGDLHLTANHSQSGWLCESDGERSRPRRAWTIEGSTHVRIFDQNVLDGNPTGTQPCTTDPTLLCFRDGIAPANGLNGVQLANPFEPGCRIRRA